MLVEPQALIDAAGRIGDLRADVESAASAAAAPTTNVPAMAADEVSAAVGAMFQDFGREFQKVQACAAQSWASFEQNLINSARGYVDVEETVTTDMGTFTRVHRVRVYQPYWLGLLTRLFPYSS